MKRLFALLVMSGFLFAATSCAKSSEASEEPMDAASEIEAVEETTEEVIDEVEAATEEVVEEAEETTEEVIEEAEESAEEAAN